MKIARVLVSDRLLLEALYLPAGTVIRTVSGVDSFGQVEMVVEHPDLRDVTLVEGEQPPLACPTFTKQSPVVFNGWGEEPASSPAVPNPSDTPT